MIIPFVVFCNKKEKSFFYKNKQNTKHRTHNNKKQNNNILTEKITDHLHLCFRMMRFKKGTIVEVLSKNELPSGSWRCAEVVCANSHAYTVEYKLDTYVSDVPMIETVSKKLIRPCPPLVELSEDWALGDILEVFQNFSWKMATVCKVLRSSECVVRLVGFSHEFKVPRSNIRVRQSWQDGKWFLIGKNFGHWEEEKSNKWSIRDRNQQVSSQVTRVEKQTNPNPKIDFHAPKNIMDLSVYAPRNRKRGFSYVHSEVEVPAKKPRKLKITENFREMPIYKAVGHSCEIWLNNPNDEDTCCVGSCSITSNDLFRSRNYFYQCSIDDECSDAESVCYGDTREGNKLPTQKECHEEIRRLELHAYRCTMEALYAFGPLSWEQETLVTNLRLSLNISNDEHLMELRHLISTGTSL